MNLHNMNLHWAQHTADSNNAIRNASMLPAKFERHRRPHSNMMQGQPQSQSGLLPYGRTSRVVHRHGPMPMKSNEMN